MCGGTPTKPHRSRSDCDQQSRLPSQAPSTTGQTGLSLILSRTTTLNGGDRNGVGIPYAEAIRIRRYMVTTDSFWVSQECLNQDRTELQLAMNDLSVEAESSPYATSPNATVAACRRPSRTRRLPSSSSTKYRFRGVLRRTSTVTRHASCSKRSIRRSPAVRRLETARLLLLPISGPAHIRHVMRA